jgi:CRISPR-associated protein Cas5d
MQRSERSPLMLRVRGPLACFTRPELKTERVSYPIMTPSAARGVLEAVLWKPAIVWRIERIRMLNPIHWIAMRRNEVASRATIPSASVIERGGISPVLLADEDRAQRNTVALRDVDYVIEARFEMTAKAGPADNPAKFVDMFRRRVENGQHFHQPYLGCREFIADVLPVDDSTPPPSDDTRDLGVMLYDIDFGSDRNRAVFFSARLEKGVLAVPSDPLVTFSSSEGGQP